MAEVKLDKSELHKRVPVILVIGYGKVGKDTTSDYLASKYGYKKKASGDKMRELQEKINPVIEHEYTQVDSDGFPGKRKLYMRYNEWVKLYGYDNAKNPRVCSGFRQSLVDLAESMKSTFGDEVWINGVLPLNADLRQGIVISDGRNLYEVMRTLHHYGLTILINRKGVAAANETEKASIANIKPGCILETVENDGTKEELYAKLDDIINRYYDGRSSKYKY
jgi:hypothetical protein